MLMQNDCMKNDEVGGYAYAHTCSMWLSVCREVQIVYIGPADFHCIPKLHRLLPHLNPDWFNLCGTSLPRLSWKRGH